MEFLEWVCENLHEENVLSETEIQEWEDLKRRSPKAILSGSRLQVGMVNLKWLNFLQHLFLDWFIFQEAIEILKTHDSEVSLQLKEEAKEQNVRKSFFFFLLLGIIIVLLPLLGCSGQGRA